MGFADIFDSYFNNLNTDSGFDILYSYLSNNSKDNQLSFDNENPKYRHSRVTIETRNDLLCIFISLPIEYENANEIISVRLRKNDKKAAVSIRRSLNKVFSGYIDLTAYSIRIEGCDPHCWKTEEYEQYILDGLLFLESHIKEKVNVSIRDLGFANLRYYVD